MPPVETNSFHETESTAGAQQAALQAHGGVSLTGVGLQQGRSLLCDWIECQ